MNTLPETFEQDLDTPEPSISLPPNIPKILRDEVNEILGLSQKRTGPCVYELDRPGEMWDAG